ncbi:metallophosphoesterase [Sagittula marina]|uniref:metallophosphoesterase n=1 Tax=Sagittula marina TaxID=943940 RepID=UPI00160762F3|nr:metallophosphoesterase [Sagittula marina]
MPSPTVIEIPDNGGTVAVMADLHLKSYFWQGSNPLKFHGLEDRLLRENVDALIVSGDLSDTFGPSLQDALAYLSRYVPADRIHLLPGNHDYYSGRLDNENRLRDLVHASGGWFAQKTELHHRSDRFLCATLWTDFDLLGDQEAAKNFAHRFMRDVDMISIEALGHVWLDPDQVLPRRIVPVTPEDIIAVHREHRAWLEERLATPHCHRQWQDLRDHASWPTPVRRRANRWSHASLSLKPDRSPRAERHRHLVLRTFAPGALLHSCRNTYPECFNRLPGRRSWRRRG